MADVQDVVVIGAGPGGFAAAMRAAQLGGTVTLVEQDTYGGNCMHRACIPTRCLTAVAQRMMAIQEAGALGIEVGPPQARVNAIHERTRQLVQGLRLGTEQLLRAGGIALVQGRATLIAQDIVQVEGQQIQTRNVILATGSVPAQPAIPGVELPGVIGTEEAIEVILDEREMPSKLAILGNQPWDIELAQAFHTLGSQVTLIVQERQLLSQADREISQRLARVLHDAGIALCRGTKIAQISQTGGETLTVVTSDGKDVVCDKLIAARRLPNTIGLGARELGIVTDRGAIGVDKRQQTHLPGIFAVGDVAALPAQNPPAIGSHKAAAEGMVAAENAMGQDSQLDVECIPYGLHTWPEVAWVGLTEERAEALGADGLHPTEYGVGRAPLAINPQALILNQTAGVCKVVIGKYGKILGAHFIGPGAIDLINALALAMLSEATVRELIRLVPLHPSIGEALVDAALDTEQRSLHLLA